jgi:hypothetical protein
MCVDCNSLETNTGLVTYSGVNLTLCTGITITNGETMTSVIEKVQDCIAIIQQEIDITGLVENSSCITLLGISIKDVLQSILNTESAFCTKLQELEEQIDLIWEAINGGPVVKNVVITSCNPTNDIKLVETSSTKTYTLGAFVPKKTILPYFGGISDFFSSGLGKPSEGLNGWAIADGRNGTINACGKYLKYDCTGCCTTGGANTVTLVEANIPSVGFTIQAEFELSGETSENGKHRHVTRNLEFGTPNCVTGTGVDGELPVNNPNVYIDCSANSGCNTAEQMGYNGLHSHTFDATATGSFVATVGNPIPSSFSIQPEYISGIPIQFIGGC